MLLEVIASVVPHGQLASDNVPSGSEGISSQLASYEIGFPTCVVNCRYSRSEPKRRPHWGHSLGKSPSIYERTIFTTSSSFMSFSHLGSCKASPTGRGFTVELDLIFNEAISGGRIESSNHPTPKTNQQNQPGQVGGGFLAVCAA